MKTLFSVFYLVTLSTFFLTGCRAKKGAEIHASPTEAKLKEKQEWLKEYALCSCIREAYPHDSIKTDISFSVLRDISDYEAPVYDKVRSEAKKAALTIEPSQIADFEGKRPYLLGCLNFYQSKALDSLIKSFPKPVIVQ
jgi:hypothetical protein